MISRAQPGFFGKLPTFGDFVSRRLGRDFVEPWDSWLQSALVAAREQLGPGWLDSYLTSPIWRFACGAGVMGQSTCTGIIMPSVDRVGRYFPLTVAVSLPTPALPSLLLHRADSWFCAIEQLALSTLLDDFDLEVFDEKLKDLAPPEAIWSNSAASDDRIAPESGKLAFFVTAARQTSESLLAAGINAALLQRFLPFHSVWYTKGSESVSSSLLICEGMPPITAYATFLTGVGSFPGWMLTSEDSVPREPVLSGTAQNAASSGPHEEDDPTAPGQAMIWKSHGISEVGCKRAINQDAYLDRPDLGLWAVADGMGGHSAGEIASAAVISALAELTLDRDVNRAAGSVIAALESVNEELRRLAEEHGNADTIIGSTAAVLICRPTGGAVLWVGDSRVYRWRSGNLEQLTVDHSLNSHGPDSGGKGWGSQESSAHRNVITRAVGGDWLLDVDVKSIDLRRGDVYLLCSDGLVREIDAGAIESSLANGDCDEIAERLIDAALDAGARDNVTVVVVRDYGVAGSNGGNMIPMLPYSKAS